MQLNSRSHRQKAARGVLPYANLGELITRRLPFPAEINGPLLCRGVLGNDALPKAHRLPLDSKNQLRRRDEVYTSEASLELQGMPEDGCGSLRTNDCLRVPPSVVYCLWSDLSPVACPAWLNLPGIDEAELSIDKQEEELSIDKDEELPIEKDEEELSIDKEENLERAVQYLCCTAITGAFKELREESLVEGSQSLHNQDLVRASTLQEICLKQEEKLQFTCSKAYPVFSTCEQGTRQQDEKMPLEQEKAEREKWLDRTAVSLARDAIAGAYRELHAEMMLSGQNICLRYVSIQNAVTALSTYEKECGKVKHTALPAD
ncbi:hypothetical protein Bbelb_270900 [Branchiostoma belcheri]|nr:hypothetical protein Bbelb_270900 [Branchiostoma belcheri]